MSVTGETLQRNGGPMPQLASVRLVATTMLVMGVVFPAQSLAQVPARFYWKTISDANAVPLIVNSIGGNTNPFDPAHTFTPGASFSALLALPGYARTFSFFDRAAMAAIVWPMGRVSGDVTVAGNSVSQSAYGFGDPMVEFDVNVLGPPAQKTLPDVLRYEPGFSLDVVADLAIPIGEYNSSQALNLGQNRWYGRVGLPIVWQLGPWVPGQRTTLEFLPAVWLFSNNTNYLEGHTLETAPMFQVDAHLTRDFTDHFWGSFDAAWYYGGEPTINGVAGKKLNNFGIGVTLGYQITDNLNLTAGYKSTVGDTGPDALHMDGFMVSLVYGWHSLLEGVGRLKGEK